MYLQETFKTTKRRVKRYQRKYEFFTLTGKIMTLVDCDKLCICNMIPSVVTKKLYKEIYSKTL